jgi:hypothetical protein
MARKIFMKLTVVEEDGSATELVTPYREIPPDYVTRDVLVTATEGMPGDLLGEMFNLLVRKEQAAAKRER